MSVGIPEASIDLETLNPECDLLAAGSYVYSEHPATKVICLAWAIDGEDPQLWYPGSPCPPRLARHVRDKMPLRGWNVVGFDRLIWARKLVPRGFPPVDDDQWRDTQHEALTAGWHPVLSRACEAADVLERKDVKGNRLMRAVASGREPLTVENAIALGNYCLQDVRTERALKRAVPRLSDAETELTRIDREINDRGVYVDLELARGIHAAGSEYRAWLHEEMDRATGGLVPTCDSVAKLTAWFKDNGTGNVTTVGAETIAAMLDHPECPEHIYRVAWLRQQGSRSSLGKAARMIAMTGSDGRLRGAFTYHRARTGRWGSNGVQVHNLVRDTFSPGPPLDNALALARRGQADLVRIAYEDPLVTLSRLLRNCFIPAPGHVFWTADYSQIEARITAWLAGQNVKLDAFRAGRDLYRIAAAPMFNLAPDALDNDQRQVGKVAELSLGFGGAAGALDKMARKFKLVLGEAEREEIVKRWRDTNKPVVKLWYKLRAAAEDAMRKPGQWFEPRDLPCALAYRFDPTRGDLCCRLPSGRLIRYPLAKIDHNDDITCHAVYQTSWMRERLWHGTFTENVVQGIARDILAACLMRMRQVGWPVVLHVHDSVTLEMPVGQVEDFLPEIVAVPHWAPGLPIAAELKGPAQRFS